MMTSVQADSIRECSALSLAGKISFGEVVQRLLAAGVERYHADYSRGETTYYLASGESLVTALDVGTLEIARAFSAPGVESAVKAAQRGEVAYPEFSRRATAAGCVGYFVLLTGKRVIYFGREGDSHTEWFPGAKRT